MQRKLSPAWLGRPDSPTLTEEEQGDEKDEGIDRDDGRKTAVSVATGNRS
jgi:hypothetical protein